MDERLRLLNIALGVVDEEFSDVVHRYICRIHVADVPEYVLIVCVSDIVGWLRIKDGNFVWRDGNLARQEAYDAIQVASPEVDNSELREALGEFIIYADEAEWPPPDPAIGEAEEFVRSIENGQKPPAWSRSSDKTIQQNPQPPAGRAATPAARPPVSAPPSSSTQGQPIEFSAYIHDRERNPAAAGFTEKDLDDVPLITVYPAVIPAIIGGFFLTIGFLGAPYEFYVVLRWAVTSMAIWMCVLASGQHRTKWGLAFAGVAVLFNPLIPVHATREFWVLPDVVGAALFATAGRKLRASRPATHNDKWSP